MILSKKDFAQCQPERLLTLRFKDESSVFSVAGPRITWILGSLGIHLEGNQSFQSVSKRPASKRHCKSWHTKECPTRLWPLELSYHFFLDVSDINQNGDVEAGCNIFTHLAFMPCNMSVCHLAVMFTCGATRTNQEVYSDAFG